jgi:hypothetical protein
VNFTLQGILSPRMFTMMIIMAIATTCITAPSVHLLYRNRRNELTGDEGALPGCQQDVNNPNCDTINGAAAAAAASCSSLAGCAVDVQGEADMSGGGVAVGQMRKDVAGNGLSTAV